MADNSFVIFDGAIIRPHEPAVPVASRGLMYGDGCFETFRLYKSRFFKLKEHLHRFRSAAEFLGIDYPETLEKGAIKEHVRKLVEKNELKERDAVARIQLWRDGERGYRPLRNVATHYSIQVTALPDIPDSVALATVPIRRMPDEALPSQFKLCNNINYITAARQADEKGADDALMQTVKGYLSETTIANIFWIKGDVVFTPSVSCDLLPGITRKIAIQLIKEQASYTLVEGEFELNDIFEADAAWICNSVREILPVQRIDHKTFDTSHNLLNSLKEAFISSRNQELV